MTMVRGIFCKKKRRDNCEGDFVVFSSKHIIVRVPKTHIHLCECTLAYSYLFEHLQGNISAGQPTHIFQPCVHYIQNVPMQVKK